MMIMTQQLDKTFDIGEDINLGIVNNVKRITENMITKQTQQVKAEITQVKTEITQVKTEIKAEITQVMANMKSMEEKMN
jgi:gas vesicle protein